MFTLNAQPILGEINIGGALCDNFLLDRPNVELLPTQHFAEYVPPGEMVAYSLFYVLAVRVGRQSVEDSTETGTLPVESHLLFVWEMSTIVDRVVG